jgi:nucleotide-binding universal stress UspA family protein
MQTILAAIDASAYAAPVCDLAAWASARLNLPVELLHVIQRKDAVAERRDLSGAIGLGVKSSLLEELIQLEEADARLQIERGRVLLAASEERLRAGGARDVRALHRHGGIVETIIEREADGHLVVIGKRGASADFAKGHLGSKVERVVRQSVKPVLVSSRAFTQPGTAVIAFDGAASARKAVAYAATSPLFEGVALHVVMAARDDRESADRLAWARELLATRIDAEVVLREGKPEDVIGQEVSRVGAQMLVMGAYGHSPLRTMLVGSATTHMIRSCTIPVLLFR